MSAQNSSTGSPLQSCRASRPRASSAPMRCRRRRAPKRSLPRSGVATPRKVRALVERTQAAGVHLHNTRNTGYANAVAALEAGATLFDASCGGLGGCPFAPRATGNIATEDLVYLLEGDGIETGVNLDALIETSVWLESMLGRRLEGQIYRAGPWAGD